MNQRLLKNGENINSQDITLFCFPFAGGGASTYTSWIKKLKDKITVCPIQLPGREERIMEKPYTDMSELLRDLTDEIVIAIKGKYALWGHSMGGKIAYELEKYLENKGYQAQCIFASGCRIPNIPEPNPIYHLKDEAFKRELERFGGTPKKVLENKELLDFFLPMLRADFTLADTYCDNSMTVLHSPMTADLLSKIKSGKSEIIDFLNEHGNLQFVRNTKGRYEKFPLTDIQNSYVVGRNTMYELGGVACHGYIEMSFDKVLDIKRLEIAWNKVIQKHDMLRAIVSNSGYQIVQEAVPYVTIQCLDLRITEGNNETDKNDFRRRLANKQYELGKWPMCDLALTVENEKSIIHLSLDMLIADFVSTNIILHDLETFYENPDLIIVPTTLYRDVVLYQNQKRTIKTVERNVAEKYWSDKIPSMGEAPDLPLKDDYALDNAKFTQKKVFLNHDMWMSFQQIEFLILTQSAKLLY